MTLIELEHEIRERLARREPVGELLAQAKRLCRYGSFVNWSMRVTGMTRKTVAKWMRNTSVRPSQIENSTIISVPTFKL